MIRRQDQRPSGFSLIEAMVTLAIAVIVMGIGVPALGGWMRDAEIRATAEALRAGLQLARLEAVQRNAVVRFNLTNKDGLAAWTVGCVRVIAHCPAIIRQSASGDTGTRIGVVTPALLAATIPASTASNLSMALAAGSGLPAGVSFDSAGRVPLNNLASDLVRIDITHRSGASGQRLVVRVGGAGLVNLCNPTALASRLEACL